MYNAKCYAKYSAEFMVHGKQVILTGDTSIGVRDSGLDAHGKIMLTLLAQLKHQHGCVELNNFSLSDELNISKNATSFSFEDLNKLVHNIVQELDSTNRAYFTKGEETIIFHNHDDDNFVLVNTWMDENITSWRKTKRMMEVDQDFAKEVSSKYAA